MAIIFIIIIYAALFIDNKLYYMVIKQYDGQINFYTRWIFKPITLIIIIIVMAIFRL